MMVHKITPSVDYNLVVETFVHSTYKHLTNLLLRTFVLKSLKIFPKTKACKMIISKQNIAFLKHSVVKYFIFSLAYFFIDFSKYKYMVYSCAK